MNFPVNSVGEIPLDYLSCSIEEKAKIAFANALEIAEQYHVKERIQLFEGAINSRIKDGN